MAILNVQDLVDAENLGQFSLSTWRTTPNVATTAGVWFDLSTAPGNPMANYYPGVPRAFTPMAYSTNDSIAHSGPVGNLGYKKYLKTFCAFTTTAAAVPLQIVICDYLGYYPFINLNAGTQTFTNTAMVNRTTNGRGIQLMCVLIGANTGVANQFYVTYTNSNGVANRQTIPTTIGAQTVPGTLMNTGSAVSRCAGPFLPLQYGDKGVQSVQSITLLGTDIGQFALVLVNPIENITVRTIDAVAERNPVIDFVDMPIIADDAAINLICLPNGSLSGAAIHGYSYTVWG